MGGFKFFDDHPGFLYVIATFLPLLSFLILLLWNGIRAYLKKFYDPEENDLIAVIYRAIDGEGKTKIGAYIATGAIGLSFVLVLLGFIQFQAESAALHSHEQPEIRKKLTTEQVKEHSHDRHHEFHRRWSYSHEWAWLSIKGLKIRGQSAGSQILEVNDTSRASILNIGFYIDHLAAIMFLMVTFIATLIHLFSIGYMSDELKRTVEDHEVHTEDGGHLKRRGRFTNFFMFLSLFCFSMLNLILANNLFQVFVSWELVGICSFLLIGFYFERKTASNAANKAFIVNRVGDAGFIIGLLILWTYVGTLNFDEIFQKIRAPEHDAHFEQISRAGQIIRADMPKSEHGKSDYFVKVLGADAKSNVNTQAILFGNHVHGDELKPGEQALVYKDPTGSQNGAMPYWMLVLAGLGIFLGCVGKSAQFPLHVWLPDAMEGPTPVSALIHAATMVAAGVYLVGRAFPLFTPEVLLVIAYIGAITLFVAATIAVVMTDIKKVLAYSTVSQLGYMMLALGLGGWMAGLFHLVTHAFFKALLFLGSGSVIYGCHHVQEMDRMGGLYSKMKITAITMLIGVFAICGLPLFSGWYSKDAIILQAFGFGSVYPHHFLLTLLPTVTAGITTFYMFRMWFMTFAGEPKDHHVFEHAKESPWVMTVPLIVLAVFSVIVAWPNLLQGDALWAAEKSWLEHQIHHSAPYSVFADFGRAPELGDPVGIGKPPDNLNIRHKTHELHEAGFVGIIALLMVAVGFTFAAAIYWFKLFDPAEAKEQMSAAHSFLAKKWHFDELYSAMVVRPALVVSDWCKWFDLTVIDGVLHTTAHITIWASWVGGLHDKYIVDGIANKIADVCYGVGSRLRNVQTGYLRNYVLFLVLAAVGLFVLLALMTGALTASMPH